MKGMIILARHAEKSPLGGVDIQCAGIGRIKKSDKIDYLAVVTLIQFTDEEISGSYDFALVVVDADGNIGKAFEEPVVMLIPKGGIFTNLVKLPLDGLSGLYNVLALWEGQVIAQTPLSIT